MDGYYVSLKKNGVLSAGSRFWFFCKKQIWHPIRSIACRLLMMLYTIALNHEIAKIFDENLFYLNFLFVLLILADGLVVVHFRHGLEDTWCSFSILFFICANTTALFMLELIVNSYWNSVFQHDLVQAIEARYKRLGDSLVLARVNGGMNNSTFIDSDRTWLETFDKEMYRDAISKYEASFCYTLITVRLILPRVGFTWTNIASMTEFTFNTLFDVYSTCQLLRDTKFTLPIWLIIFNYCVTNAQLICVALNMSGDDIHDNDAEEATRSPKLSPLRKLVESYYFQYTAQILFAEIPFLISRIIVVFRWYNLVKGDIQYSIGKQVIIITCKVVIMIDHKYKSYVKKRDMRKLIELNNMYGFDEDE